MSVEVKLPRLGQGMESGTIVRWLKSEGDTVEKGEPLFEVDTDKATQEVEAETSGVLLAIAVSAGEVPVGVTVAVIGEAGEEAVLSSAPAEDEAAPAPTGQSAGPAAPPAARPGGEQELTFRAVVNGAREKVSGGRVKASPLARRMARERGLELGELSGTGPEGRIVAEDVERAERASAAEPSPPVEPAREPAAAVPPEPAATPESTDQPEPEPSAPVSQPTPASEPQPVPAALADVESIPLTRIRRTIARRLTEAWQVPVFQLTVSVQMTQANALIERSRELTPDVRVTVTDLITRVCARALIRHPEVNVQFTEAALLRFPSANVGIAVAAPQGLVVPVVHGAERLSLTEIALRREELVARSRDASLQRADLEGGTFTISNLGMFGIEQFSAVLNPPQAAILAVGATVERPVARQGEVVVRPMLTVTLTVDHRAVDGAPAADFLRTVKTFLEDPALAL